MTSYDFFAPCSTPKRQRTSSERERFIDLPIEGPSRRKTPAYLDLSGSDFQPFFNGLPLDSPTPKQFAPSNIPAWHAFPKFRHTGSGPWIRGKIDCGGRLEVRIKFGLSKLPLITHEDLENVDIPFQPPGFIGVSLQRNSTTTKCLCGEPTTHRTTLTRSQSYFLERPWQSAGDYDSSAALHLHRASISIEQIMRTGKVTQRAQKIINTIRCEATKSNYTRRTEIFGRRSFTNQSDSSTWSAKILALTTEGPDYIYRRTGIVRHRKQVSSHIQVIKNSKKLDPLSEILDPINHSQSVSFDRCSAIGPYNINHPLKVKRNIVFFSIKWLICGIRERSFDPSFTVGLKEARIRTTTRSVKTGKTLIGCL
ncbi:hypothetical protein PSTT_02409, partial [Puccinia striiformis]